MVVFLVGKDTLKISEAYINAFPAFSCPLFASKTPIVNGVRVILQEITTSYNHFNLI